MSNHMTTHEGRMPCGILPPRKHDFQNDSTHYEYTRRKLLHPWRQDAMWHQPAMHHITIPLLLSSSDSTHACCLSYEYTRRKLLHPWRQDAMWHQPAMHHITIPLLLSSKVTPHMHAVYPMNTHEGSCCIRGGRMPCGISQPCTI